MDTDEYIHKELSEDIVGAAMTVLNTTQTPLEARYPLTHLCPSVQSVAPHHEFLSL